MKLFPTIFILRHQAKLLFAVIWLHVTILDLWYVTYSGPVFFWQESLQLKTIFIHLTIAVVTLGFYLGGINICARFKGIKITNLLNSSKRPSN